MTLAFLTGGMEYAVLAPFLPIEATDKGLSGSQFGLIFAAFEAAMLIFNPIAAALIPRIGCRSAATLGSTLLTIATLGFAFVTETPDGWSFFAAAVGIRIAAGIAASLTQTALLTVLMTSFPAHLSILLVSLLSPVI